MNTIELYCLFESQGTPIKLNGGVRSILGLSDPVMQSEDLQFTPISYKESKLMHVLVGYGNLTRPIEELSIKSPELDVKSFCENPDNLFVPLSGLGTLLYLSENRKGIEKVLRGDEITPEGINRAVADLKNEYAAVCGA